MDGVGQIKFPGYHPKFRDRSPKISSTTACGGFGGLVRAIYTMHSFIYPGPGQRDTSVADLRTTLENFGTNHRKIRLDLGGRAKSEFQTLVGERSRNSDLGGRAKSEFRPRWESKVGIPTSVGERSRNSDLGGRAKSEFRRRVARARQAGGFDARQRLRYLAGTWRVPEVPSRHRMTV